MNRYICTFGAGQENEGKYVLVIASNMDKAIDKMFEEYGNDWCMCYSENQWNNTPSYIPKETLLRTIVVEEVL